MRLADWVIEPLSSGHDRSSFSCGKPSLDDFLKTKANRYAKKDMGRTYVAVRHDENIVRGYFTLSTGSVEFEHLPEETAKKLPTHPIPVFLLARMAVDQSNQGQGLGKIILIEVLRLSLDAGKTIAAHAIAVDAIDDDARKFYLHFGFKPLTDDPNHLFISMKVVRQLDLS